MKQIVITAIVLLQASVLLHKSTCDVVFLNTQESLAPQPSSSAFTPALSPGKKKLISLTFLFLSIFFRFGLLVLTYAFNDYVSFVRYNFHLFGRKQHSFNLSLKKIVALWLWGSFLHWVTRKISLYLPFSFVTLISIAVKLVTFHTISLLGLQFS